MTQLLSFNLNLSLEYQISTITFFNSNVSNLVIQLYPQIRRLRVKLSISEPYLL